MSRSYYGKMGDEKLAKRADALKVDRKRRKNDIAMGISLKVI